MDTLNSGEAADSAIGYLDSFNPLWSGHPWFGHEDAYDNGRSLGNSTQQLMAEVALAWTGAEALTAGLEALTAAEATTATAAAAREAGATFGNAASTNYRATFFAAHPELEGQVVVHHAVEQQVLTRYPGVASEAEIHSLENLRGIPKEINSDVHLSKIRCEWNKFYRETPNPSQQQLLQKATEIDNKFGSQFKPPVGGG